MGFSRQEYWSGLPFSSPGDLSNPGIEPASPALAGWFFTTSTTGKLFLDHEYVCESCSAMWTLCDPVDYSLPGSSVHGILQVRILKWVAIPFSRRSSQPKVQTPVSQVAGRFFSVWATREARFIVDTKLICARSSFSYFSWHRRILNDILWGKHNIGGIEILFWIEELEKILKSTFQFNEKKFSWC